jgi:DNA-binding GntR family transcriptional regulator
MAKIRKLTKKGLPLNERVFRILKGLIVDNSLKPGEWLVESALAKALGVSRSPVREALVKLENERLVEVVPPRGARVMPLSAKYFNEVYEIRCALECLAARKAAPLVTDRDLERLEAILEEMQGYLDQEDYIAWSKRENDVHQTLVSKADNDLLKEDINKLRDHFSRAIDFGSNFPNHIRKSHQEHQAIHRAMKTRSPGLVEEAVRTHVENVGRRLVEAFGNSLQEHKQD